MKTSKLLLLQSLLLLTGAACGGVEGEELETETASSGLGEMACTLGIADATHAASPWVDGSNYVSNSPDTSYTHRGCVDQFVVQIDNTDDRDLDYVGGWGEPLPATQNACLQARAEMGAYGLREDRTWTLIFTQTFTGQWTNGSCRLVGTPITHPALSRYLRIRVAVKAFVQSGAKRIARAGVHANL